MLDNMRIVRYAKVESLIEGLTRLTGWAGSTRPARKEFHSGGLASNF